MPEPVPVALITGAAQRIGATIARHLHGAGYRVIIHYRGSAKAAEALRDELNGQRAASALALAGDLGDPDAVRALARDAERHWQALDLLVNNASGFYPTPLERATESDWDELLGSNLKGPFFLCQALTPALRASRGSIVNIVDIYAERPLPEHSIYCIAKAGMAMLTRSLAQELAPYIRVNGVAPGAILWPEQQSEFRDQEQRQLNERVPLKRKGEPEDIADTVLFLAGRGLCHRADRRGGRRAFTAYVNVCRVQRLSRRHNRCRALSYSAQCWA
jgi:pteridine reductase